MDQVTGETKATGTPLEEGGEPEQARLRMPESPERDLSGEWVHALRRFHLTGTADRIDGTDGPLVPAALAVPEWKARTELDTDAPDPWSRLLGTAADNWSDELVRTGSGIFAAEMAKLRQTSGVEEATAMGVLAAAACHLERRVRLQAFEQEIETLIRGLRNLVGTSEADLQDELGATLGSGADSFIDATALARALPPDQIPEELSAARRQRLEAVLESLHGHLAAVKAGPDLVLLYREGPDLKSELPIELYKHQRPIDAAVECFDRLAAEMMKGVDAMRLAAHELADQGAPAEGVEGADWKRLEEDELRLMPTVMVVDTAQQLLELELSEFSGLLRSGRPLKVIATDRVDAQQAPEDLVENSLTLGHLAIAHRETLVVQGTLARTNHLIRGLRSMAASSRPSALLVATAGGGGPSAHTLLEAAHLGRQNCCLTYDPDAGSSWVERFDLEPNLDAERNWPQFDVEFADARGLAGRQTEEFTFTHAAALSPGYRGHYWILPREAWTSELVEISRYLDMDRETQVRSVPFLWVVAEGELARAAMTQELAFACKDRLRAWRLLQELAAPDQGSSRLDVEQEVADVRNAANEEVRRLQAAHAEELEVVKRRAKLEAVERLTIGLLGQRRSNGATAAGGAVGPKSE